MDMKKAFDTVKHGTLFRKLIDRKLPLVYIRLFIVMYMNQSAQVKWKGSLSEAFSIVNGVKQGAVISAILFCVYIDDLIKVIRRNKDGCWINDTFVGVIIYADDIALLSPSLDGLQNMIDSCNNYAKKHNLNFSTDVNPQKSKTKCVAFHIKRKPVRKLKLDNKDLPWVDSVKHLGSTIQNNPDCHMRQDTSEKRAMYIAKNNELNHEFFYTDPRTKIWLNNVYNSSFYGAPLWNLFDREFEKLEKTWNVSQRVMLSLPRRTHRYFVEPLSCTTHISRSIKKRFVGFIERIRRSKKEPLRCMLRTIEHDCRSTTGGNIRRLEIEASKLNEEKSDLSYVSIPYGSEWKIQFAKELVDIKAKNLVVQYFTQEEIENIAEYVCCE